MKVKKPAAILKGYMQRIASVSETKPKKAKRLTAEAKEYAEQAIPTYQEACALYLEAQADLMRAGKLDDYNRVVTELNQVTADMDALIESAKEFDVTPDVAVETDAETDLEVDAETAALVSEGGVEGQVDYGDEDLEKHAQVLGAAIVTHAQALEEGNLRQAEVLTEIVADGIEELLTLEAKAQTRSRSQTKQAYRRIRRHRPKPKTWKCCDAVVKHKTLLGKNVWASVCWYQNKKTRLHRPMFVKLGNAKKNPKPRFVVLQKKKMHKCTAGEEKKFALMNAKLSKLAIQAKRRKPASTKPQGKRVTLGGKNVVVTKSGNKNIKVPKSLLKRVFSKNK